jgi:hypothetical protein
MTIVALVVGLVAVPGYAVNSLSVNASAALTGSSGSACGGSPCGLQVLMDSGSDAYVQSDHPAAETTYNVTYRIDPNGIALPGTKYFVVFNARKDTAGHALHILHYMRRNAGETQWKLIVWVREDTAGFPWQSVANFRINPDTEVKMEWGAGAGSGFIRVFKNGVLKGQATGLQNNSYNVDQVQFGTTFATTAGAVSGSYFLDEFLSTR